MVDDKKQINKNESNKRDNESLVKVNNLKPKPKPKSNKNYGK